MWGWSVKGGDDVLGGRGREEGGGRGGVRCRG